MGYWNIKIECVKDGEAVEFENLDECDREHVLECVRDGYYSGELNDDNENGED